MRILLKFLRKFDRLLDIQKPSLSCLLVLACIYLFVGFLDGEVKQFLLHIECHILLLYDLEAV